MAVGNRQNRPRVIAQAASVGAQYTVVVEGGGRDALAAALKDEGIPTAVYYPRPLNLQSASRHYPVAGGGLPVAEQLCRPVLSLPMHPCLEPPTQACTVAAVRRAATSLSRRRQVASTGAPPSASLRHTRGCPPFAAGADSD